MASIMEANTLYGPLPGRAQPAATGAEDAARNPDEPEPMGRTEPRDTAGAAGDPVLALVVLLGLAVVLVNLSLRGFVGLEVGG